MPDLPPLSITDRVALYAAAALGGMADAGSYLLAGSFTGHVTGNAVLTAVHVGRGQWVEAGRPLWAIAMFVVGTSVGVRRERWREAFATEAILLAIGLSGRWAAGDTTAGHLWLIGCLSAGLGLQNGALQRVGRLSVHTTYITGQATALTTALVSGQRRRRDDVAGVIVTFLAGAIGSSVLVHRYRLVGLVAVIVPAVALLVCCRPTPADTSSTR